MIPKIKVDLNIVNIECLNCKKVFTVTRREKYRKYCSRKCSNTGIHNPFYNRRHTKEAKKIIGIASTRIHTGRKRKPRTREHIENLRMSVIRNGNLAGKNNPAYKGIINKTHDDNFTKNLKEYIHLQNMWQTI